MENWQATAKAPKSWVSWRRLAEKDRVEWKIKMASNKVKRVNLTAGEKLQMACCKCRRGEEMKTRGMRKCREREGERTEGKGESRVIVGRLTTPHDLIVMLKTAGEAGRRVGGQDASHHILQRCVTEGGRGS